MHTPHCWAPPSSQTSAPAPPLPLPLLCVELKRPCVERPQPSPQSPNSTCPSLLLPSHASLCPAPACLASPAPNPVGLASLMPQLSSTPPLVCAHLLVPRPILTFATDMAADSVPDSPQTPMTPFTSHPAPTSACAPSCVPSLPRVTPKSPHSQAPLPNSFPTHSPSPSPHPSPGALEGGGGGREGPCSSWPLQISW